MATSSNPIAALRRPAAALAVVALALLAPAPAAFASVGVGSGAAGPSLRVDAKGNAEISYTQGGAPETVLVPVTGAVIYGGQLTGPDVSKAATRPKLPFLKVLRSGPNGWFYALQTWPARIGPAELRFSRWQGEPDQADVHGDAGARRHRSRGQGHLRRQADPDDVEGARRARDRASTSTSTSRSAASGRLLGGVVGHAATGRTGGSSTAGRPGTCFRASVAGPNIGAVYAPDVVVQIPPP